MATKKARPAPTKPKTKPDRLSFNFGANVTRRGGKRRGGGKTGGGS